MANEPGAQESSKRPPVHGAFDKPDLEGPQNVNRQKYAASEGKPFGNLDTLRNFLGNFGIGKRQVEDPTKDSEPTKE